MNVCEKALKSRYDKRKESAVIGQVFKGVNTYGMYCNSNSEAVVNLIGLNCMECNTEEV